MNALEDQGPDLQNILRFIVRSTYDSHFQKKRAKISTSNIESNLRTLFSDNLTILQVGPTLRSFEMFCKLAVRRKPIVTLKLS